MRICAIHFRRRPRHPRRRTVAAHGSRVAVVLLLIYQAVFLNIFVPSHTPGMITVDGSTPVASAGHQCCDPGVDDHDGGDGDQQKSDDSSNRARCAVCHLVARLTPAVAVDMKLPEHGLLELLPALRPHVAESAAAFPTYLGRGPPARAHLSVA